MTDTNHSSKNVIKQDNKTHVYAYAYTHSPVDIYLNSRNTHYIWTFCSVSLIYLFIFMSILNCYDNCFIKISLEIKKKVLL